MGGLWVDFAYSLSFNLVWDNHGVYFDRNPKMWNDIFNLHRFLDYAMVMDLRFYGDDECATWCCAWCTIMMSM